jgi:chaperonin GroEL
MHPVTAPIAATDCESYAEQRRSTTSRRHALDVDRSTPIQSRMIRAVAGSNNRITNVAGVEPDYFRIRNWGTVRGRLLSSDDVQQAELNCVIGQTLADRLFPGLDPLDNEIRLRDLPCRVVGVLEVKGGSMFGADQDDIALMPFSTFSRRIAGNTRIATIMASARNAERVDAAKAELVQILRQRRHVPAGETDDFTVRDPRELQALMQRVTAVLTTLLAGVAAISLFVGGIGIMNIMLVSVTERTREIGIRLAVGARAHDILLQFLVEAILLSASGGLLGIALGLGAARAIAAIWSEGLRNVVAGASAVDLKRGLERGLSIANGALTTLSRPIATKKERAQIATVSAHNDASIGDLVADATERVGSDGVITVEEAKTITTELEVVEGMQFDHGYLSAYFVTSSDRMECVLESPLILIYDKRISSMAGLVPVLERVAQSGRPFMLIAEDVEGEALATLVVNRLRGTLPCVAVKAPGFGDRRKAMLEDIAVLTGGRVVAEELGMKLDKVDESQLGSAARVIVTRDATTLVGGRGDKQAIAGRIELIRREIKDCKSDYDREKLEERLAKLTGGVAVIRVGAPSEAELKNKKEAFDDAINATKAATAEGIVPGAGLSLLRMAAAVEREAATAEGDERTGLRILAHALEAPARQIAENSDADPGVVVDKMRAGQGAFGFDAAVGRYVDLFEAGIIDPTKVIRVALENAVSLAGVLLLTEATLTEVPDKNDKPEPGMGAGEFGS